LPASVLQNRRACRVGGARLLAKNALLSARQRRPTITALPGGRQGKKPSGNLGVLPAPRARFLCSASGLAPRGGAVQILNGAAARVGATTRAGTRVTRIVRKRRGKRSSFGRRWLHARLEHDYLLVVLIQPQRGAVSRLLPRKVGFVAPRRGGAAGSYPWGGALLWLVGGRESGALRQAALRQIAGTATRHSCGLLPEPGLGRSAAGPTSSQVSLFGALIIRITAVGGAFSPRSARSNWGKKRTSCATEPDAAFVRDQIEKHRARVSAPVTTSVGCCGTPGTPRSRVFIGDDRRAPRPGSQRSVRHRNALMLRRGASSRGEYWPERPGPPPRHCSAALLARRREHVRFDQLPFALAEAVFQSDLAGLLRTRCAKKTIALGPIRLPAHLLAQRNCWRNQWAGIKKPRASFRPTPLALGPPFSRSPRRRSLRVLGARMRKGGSRTRILARSEGICASGTVANPCPLGHYLC